jgi:endonuclease/exonuclease/phosphatase family metal-dependent hydrolase
MPELVLLTWNLQGRAPGELRLADAIREWRPDLLLLQEANGDQLGEVLPAPYQSRLWWPAGGSIPGIVIASHLPLEEQGLLEPVDPPWDRPRVAWARLRLEGGPLTVASVHLRAPIPPGTLARRNAQLRALTTWAEARIGSGERLAIGGDFNTHNPRLSGMTDACGDAPRPTWRLLAKSWLNPVLRLDAIFLAPGIRVLDATVGNRWRGSDHLPVVVRVAV